MSTKRQQQAARNRQRKQGPPVLAVVGPTATGKSDLAVALAQQCEQQGQPVRILNADAMQLYQGMDIGTAKLSEAERGGITHELLDIWPVTEAASVAEYQRLARERIDVLIAEGTLPILVGGSGLYVSAVLDDLNFPGTDQQVRDRLTQELAEQGSVQLHEQLREKDPDAAKAILVSNGRRIVRALEVIEITGQPFSATFPPTGTDRGWYRSIQLGLRMDRLVLRERIATRVDRMWEQGLLNEVQGLISQGLLQGPTAAKALGYAQILMYLQGEYDLEAARMETITRTRQFARRQEMWFGRDERIQWLEASQPASALLAQASELIESSKE